MPPESPLSPFFGQPYQPLSRQEEWALWRRLKTCHDQDARRQLIERYTPLVLKVVTGFRIHPDDQADAVQEGVLGLMEAVDRFDPLRGCFFSTFAAFRIRGMVVTHLTGQRDYRRRFVEDGSETLQAIPDIQCEMPATTFAQERFLAQVGHCAQELTPQERAVFWGMTVQEKPGVALAGELQTTSSMVSRFKRRAAAKLRNALRRVGALHG